MASSLYLTPKEIASRYGITVRTLLNWRREGSGPEYIRLNTKLVRYPLNKFEEWIRRNTRTQS